MDGWVETMNNWATPKAIFDPLNQEFGFTLDVCAESWNAKTYYYYTEPMDALKLRWSGVVWMNPPYGREIKYWIKKAYLSSLEGATVVCLVPSKTDTDWWHDYCLKGEIRFYRGRIHFIDRNGKSGRPRFASALVIFRPKG